MQEWTEVVTKQLNGFIAILAVFVIAVALVRFLLPYIRGIAKPKIEEEK